MATAIWKSDVDFSNSMPFYFEILSHDTEKIRTQEVNSGLDERLNKALYSYLNQIYSNACDVYKFPNGRNALAFCLDGIDAVSFLKTYHLPVFIVGELRLSPFEEILRMYISFDLKDDNK